MITATTLEVGDTNNVVMEVTTEVIVVTVAIEVDTTITTVTNMIIIKTTRPMISIKTKISIKMISRTTSKYSKETEVEGILDTKTTTETMTSNIILDRREVTTIVNIKITVIKIIIHFTETRNNMNLKRTMMTIRISITAIIIRIIRNKFDNQD